MDTNKEKEMLRSIDELQLKVAELKKQKIAASLKNESCNLTQNAGPSSTTTNASSNPIQQLLPSAPVTKDVRYTKICIVAFFFGVQKTKYIDLRQLLKKDYFSKFLNNMEHFNSENK